MQRQQFLAEASRLLAESIDYEAALQSVARLAVPDIADWCAVDVRQHDGTMARVAMRHKAGPQSFDDAMASDSERRRLLNRLGLHSYICTPLVSRGRVLGTMTFFSEGGRAFGDDDVAMAEELARLLAMAIDIARLDEQVQRVTQSRDEMFALVSGLIHLAQMDDDRVAQLS